MSNQNQQAVPTKEQIKIGMRKIAESQQARESNFSVTEDIVDDKTQNDNSTFNNEQMLLHLYDVIEEIKLKFSQELISRKGDFKIIYNNQIVQIEPCLVEGAFAYKELNKKYKLEAKTLIQEIIKRMGVDNSYINESSLIDFFKEIRRQKKNQIETAVLKSKIAWIKK